jgi:hypothetical protein
MKSLFLIYLSLVQILHLVPSQQLDISFGTTCTSCCGIPSRMVKRVLHLVKIMCFVQPSWAKVYSQTKWFNGLRSSDDVSEALGENKSGKLSSNHFRLRLALWDGPKYCLETKVLAFFYFWGTKVTEAFRNHHTKL